jgi:hypothetical protein
MSDDVSNFIGNMLGSNKKIENWVCIYKEVGQDYGRVLTSLPIEDTINILRHYANLLEKDVSHLIVKGKLH